MPLLNRMKRFRLMAFLVIFVGANVSGERLSAGPMWAYKMASHECQLLESGTPRPLSTQLTYEKFPEYGKYIDEYGVDEWVGEMIEQCPQFSSISQDGNTGGSANQEPVSDCSLDGSQIYDISRGRKVVVSGTNCVMSFN